jgi:hypothetical protein
MSEVKARPVAAKQDLNAFIRLSYEVYANDPNWVPPLESDLAETLTPGKNPFWEHAERELFLAEKDGKAMGRIAAIIDRNYVDYHKDPVGFFGFLEVVKDYEAADALFTAARDWLRGKGMTKIRGPANPSLSDEAGMLLEGFDSPPVVKMSYNPPYYLEFCEKSGMTKAKDLFAYYIKADQPVPEKFQRVIRLLKSRPGLVVRPINLRNLREDLRKIKEVYNDAWSRNWDFAPMTEAEIEDMAKKLKPLVVPEIVPIVEIAGEVAGMAVALPDYNQVLIHMRGKLNVLKFLYYRSKINGARLWALGLKEKFRHQGLDALLYYEAFTGGLKKGYKWGELSWILEDNVSMIRPILQWNTRLYKKYRIFEMAIPGQSHENHESGSRKALGIRH